MSLFRNKLRVDRSTIAFSGFLVLLPVLVFYVTGARSIEPINGQDGYAYVGIVARTQDFLTRFPDSYFGTRFGYVLPSVLFHRLFGFEVGHHLLRFLFLGCLANLMRIRGQVRTITVVMTVILFCLSPIVLVSTFSTYTMSLGALFLLSGLLLLATYDLEGIRNLLIAALSSSLLAMAWNSHLQLLLPSVVIFGVLIVDQSLEKANERFASLVQLGIAGLFGAGLTCALGSLILGIRYGVWNPWAPGLRFASSPVKDAFTSSGFDWITWRHYVLLVPISLFIGVAVWLTEENPVLRRVIRRMTFASFGMSLVYVLYQWGLKGIAFETFYHSSGLLITSLTTILLSVAVVIDRNQNKLFYVMNLTVVAAITYLIGARVEIDFSTVLIFSFLTTSCFVTAIIWLQKIRYAAVSALIMVCSLVTVSSPHNFPASAGGYRTDPLYDDALYSYDKSSMNRAIALDKLALLLPSLPLAKGEILVWFDPVSKYDQLSAPFLWYESALQSPADPAPPVVTKTVIHQINSRTPRYIVVIDGDFKKVKEGSRALVELANYESVWMKRIKESDFTVFVSLLER